MKKTIILLALLSVSCATTEKMTLVPTNQSAVSITDTTVTKNRTMIMDFKTGIIIGIHLMKYVKARDEIQKTMTIGEVNRMCQDAIEGKNVFELYPLNYTKNDSLNKE